MQVLLLAWKMGAQRMGFFSREEFVRGVKQLNAATLDKLRKSLPKLEDEVSSDPEAFSSFFTFAFKYLLTVGRFSLSSHPLLLQLLPALSPCCSEVCDQQLFYTRQSLCCQSWFNSRNAQLHIP